MSVVAGRPTQLREFRLKGHTFQLNVTSQLFTPNATTRLFSKSVDIREGDIVFDIGSGVGPLGIWAAKCPSKRVYSVEIVPEQFELLNRNVTLNGVGEKIETFCGPFFEPIPDGIKADVIIADVSGIAEGPARALKWFPPGIPTGGKDGAEIICRVLDEAANYMADGARLYFPIAIGLSDHEKIMQFAHKKFGSLERVVDVHFPISQEDGDKFNENDWGCDCLFITPRENPTPQRAYTWQGQIYEATNPIS